MYDTISTILIRWLKSKSYIRSNNNFISRGKYYAQNTQFQE